MRMRRVLIGLAATAAAALVAAALLKPPAPAGDAGRAIASYGPAIANTAAILDAGAPERKSLLRVLFYGQSITASGWHEEVVRHWRARYPNTEFVVENLAIGGFPAQSLVRAAERDLAAFHPDLIVFHVYGDHRKYEEIIKLFRTRTTADIIVQTDHGDVMPEPVCRTGLTLALKPAPGCKGLLWARQRVWEDFMSFHFIPQLAEKYDLVVEPQRTLWKQHLLETGLAPSALLSDGVHLNDAGEALMARLMIAFFDELIEAAAPAPSAAIAAPPLTIAASGDMTASFTGVRLEADMPAQARQDFEVVIDGRPAREHAGCYVMSRASPPPDNPDWPAIRRIGSAAAPLEESWTATLSNISADGARFDFAVAGSVTGADGEGRSDKPFVSRSRRIVIDPQDWLISPAAARSLAAGDVTPAIRWHTDYVCDDVKTYGAGEGARLRRTLAAGLEDGPHEIRLSPGDGSAPAIERLIAYSPKARR